MLKAELASLTREYQDREDLNKTEYERELEKLIDLENKHMKLTS